MRLLGPRDDLKKANFFMLFFIVLLKRSRNVIFKHGIFDCGKDKSPGPYCKSRAVNGEGGMSAARELMYTFSWLESASVVPANLDRTTKSDF